MPWDGKQLKGTILRGSRKGAGTHVVVRFDDGDEWSVDMAVLQTADGTVIAPSPKLKSSAKAPAKARAKSAASPSDLLLACFYAFCIFGNISVDLFMGLDKDLKETGWAYHRTVHAFAAVDPLFLQNSFYMRYSALFTAVAFAPYYVLGIRAFLKGQGLGKRGSLTRKYANVYAIGMSANMTIVLALECIEFWKQSALAPQLGAYWLTVVPYWVVPLLVKRRLTREAL